MGPIKAKKENKTKEGDKKKRKIEKKSINLTFEAKSFQWFFYIAITIFYSGLHFRYCLVRTLTTYYYQWTILLSKYNIGT